MEVQIRALTLEDYSAAAEIFRQVHALHQENRPDIYRALDNPLSAAYFAQMCSDPNGIALCAVYAERIAGVAYTYIKPPSVNPVVQPRVTAFMDDLAVHPDFRGQGVGKTLLEESARLAVKRGACSLELMVWAFNRNAIEFYEHAGMTPRSIIMEMPLDEVKVDAEA